MTDCLFCKFANKEIPKEFTLETDQIMVFPDIAPVAPVHFLIVPKKHIAEFSQLKEKERKIWNEMIKMADDLIKKYELVGQGYRIVINGGGAQAIDHLHLHLMGKINKERKL